MSFMRKYRAQLLAVSAVAITSVALSFLYFRRKANKDGPKKIEATEKKEESQPSNQGKLSRAKGDLSDKQQETDGKGSVPTASQQKAPSPNSSSLPPPVPVKSGLAPPEPISSGLGPPPQAAAAAAGAGAGDEEGGADDDPEQKALAEYLTLASQATKRFKAGQFERAAEIYSTLLAMLPEVPGKAGEELTLYNNRSAMFEKLGKYDECMADCTKVLMLDPNHEKVRLRRARVLTARGDPEAALRELAGLVLQKGALAKKMKDQGLPVSPPAPPELLPEVLEAYAATVVPALMAEKKAKKGALPSSEVVLTTVLGFEMWARVQEPGGDDEGKGEEELAREVAEAAALGDALGGAAARHARARRGLRRRDFDAARADLEAAHSLLEAAGQLDVYPDLAEMLSWLAMFWLHGRENERAKATFVKCAALEPGNAEHLCKQAALLIDEASEAKDGPGDVAPALALLDRAEALDASCPDVYIVRGLCFLTKNDTEGAEREMQRALERRPDLTAAYQRLFLIKMQRGDVLGGQELLRRGLEACGRPLELLAQESDLAFSMGNRDEAMRAIDLAIELHPDRATPYLSKAVVLMNTPGTDMSEVQEVLQKGIELDPKNHALYFQLVNTKIQSATSPAARAECLRLLDTALDLCADEEEVSFMARTRGYCAALEAAGAAAGLTEFSLAGEVVC